MKAMKFTAILALPGLLLATPLLAQSTSASSSTSRNADTPAADNSKSNRTVSTNHNVTADQQKNDAADIDLVKRIRQDVMADKGLSTYGHNVKIIAVNGRVTLNGVVRDMDEKSAINKKAAAIAGPTHVVDELKIAP
jgi:osmotically-inducible protein OsmY